MPATAGRVSLLPSNDELFALSMKCDLLIGGDGGN